MRYLSVCSGIEAASVAWHPLGWAPVAFSEVDAFPSAVLTHHYPSVPNWGDMTKFQEWPDADVDVLVGGTPCQSFSVAGLRKGLDDPRGSLMLVYLAIARKYRPRWVVWENVPGVLSADEGRAFGSLLGGLGELGYGASYRVLDAQHFGVAQRRRRVFVVGCLGDWRRAAAVLFERESLSGHPAPRREAGQGATYSTAPSLTGSGRGTARAGESRGQDCLIPQTVGALCDGAHMGGGSTGRTPTLGASLPCVANPLTARMGKGINTTCDEGQTLIPGQIGGVFDGPTHSLRADDASEDGTGRGTPLVPTIAPCLTRNYGKQPDSSDTNAGPMLIPVAHAFDARQSDVIQYGDKAGPLDTDGSSIGVMTLAIRGRAEGAQLEVRDDGTANAVLTPSGGRGGIGVGAVAFSAKDYGADAGEIAPTLRAGGHTGGHANGGVMPAVAQHMAVRRLTPRECERLQGFPDDYTLIPYGKPSKRKLDADFLKYQLRGNPKHLKRDDIDRIAADGPRYKALGNSMAVPVMAWIGKRIQMVEEL